MGLNPSSLSKLNMIAGTLDTGVPAMEGIWLCAAAPSTVRSTDVCQTEAAAHDPARQHQRCHGGEAAGETDPDSNAVPVAGKGEPGADPETHNPVTDERKQQRPAGVVQPAEHARA